jgi:hypothetical protein
MRSKDTKTYLELNKIDKNSNKVISSLHPRKSQLLIRQEGLKLTKNEIKKFDKIS